LLALGSPPGFGSHHEAFAIAANGAILKLKVVLPGV
jgi:hypothetical protein